MHILPIVLMPIFVVMYVRKNGLFLWHTEATSLSWYYFALGTAYLATSVIAYEICAGRPDHGIYAVLDIVCSLTTLFYGMKQMAMARGFKYMYPS